MPPAAVVSAGRWNGKVRNSPAGVNQRGRLRSRRGRWFRGRTRAAPPEGCHLPLAFLRLERAGGVDEQPSGATSVPPRASIFRCSSAMRLMSSTRFKRRMSGWRRIVPVALQGASSITTSKVRPGDHVAASASTTSAASAGGRGSRADARGVRPRHRRPLHAPPTARAGRLAAGSRAQVGDAAAGDISGEAYHQRGGRILHPPAAVGEAWQILDAAVRVTRTEPVGSSVPPSFSAHACASVVVPGFNVRSSGASVRLASAMRRAVSGP